MMLKRSSGVCSEVEEQPFPGAVNVGERALVVDHPIAVGAMREEARGRALFFGPDAPDAGVLGVQEVDCRHDPVDWDAQGVQARSEAG